MPRLPDLMSGLKMLRELDLNTVRQAAEAPFYLSVVGDEGVGKSTLIAQLLSGPRAGEPPGLSPVGEYRLDKYTPHTSPNLVLLIVDSKKSEHKHEQQLVDRLYKQEIPVIVCYNKLDSIRNEGKPQKQSLSQHGDEVITIIATDRDSVIKQLVPALLRACNHNEVQLARHLPIVRETVSRSLIDDTCLINATYSLSTGLAEIVPVLNIPLNIADLLVLTKNQAYMAYKITLALGLPPDWRETIPKLATVVGTAFIWRQLARQLVGLIPAYGIIPKVAIAYAGTYTIGQVIYQWCANGEKLRPEALKALYVEALRRGSDVAQTLVAKGDTAQQDAAERFRVAVRSLSVKSNNIKNRTSDKFSEFRRLAATKSKVAQVQTVGKIHQLFARAPICPNCEKRAPKGALYCAFCGVPLVQPKEGSPDKKK